MALNLCALLSLGQSFSILCSFLSMRDKVRLTTTAKCVREQLLRGDCWGVVQISDDMANHLWSNHVQWIARYCSIIRPRTICICINSITEDTELLPLFPLELPSVQAASIFCESESLHLSVSLVCSNLKRITLSSTVVSDQLFELMCYNLDALRQIQIQKDDFGLTLHNISNCVTGPIKKFVLKCHHVSFERIKDFLVAKASSLQELQLDVEECPEQLLGSIICSLKRLQRLRLFHMQNISSATNLTTVLGNRICKLSLTKTYQISLCGIVQAVASLNLTQLDLTEGPSLRDGDLQDLAVKAYNLKTLNISWCNGVSDIGVRAVIDNCLLLERLVLTGLKDLSDAAFTEYAMLKPYFLEGSTLGSQTIADQFLNATPALLFGRKTLRNLSLLECSSCNNVSDSLLRLLACLLTKAVVLNYYGAHMEFAKTYVFP